MPPFAVHLLFFLEVQAEDASDPLRELAIHVPSASDEEEAVRRGETIGRERQHAWRNDEGEEVRDVLLAVADVQSLLDAVLGDGMEASSWCRRGEWLMLGKGWRPDSRARLHGIQ